MSFQRPRAAALLLLPALLAGCCLPYRYTGDGHFVDRCGFLHPSFGFSNRYILDFGELDLQKPSTHTYRVGGLPRARIWLLGLDVIPRPGRPAAARLDEVTVAVSMIDQQGQKVIREASPLRLWDWERSAAAEAGIGPAFVYLAGRGTSRLAHGGRGTFFEPSPETRFVLAVEVTHPDPDAQHFTVRLRMKGSDEIGSL